MDYYEAMETYSRIAHVFFSLKHLRFDILDIQSAQVLEGQYALKQQSSGHHDQLVKLHSKRVKKIRNYTRNE